MATPRNFALACVVSFLLHSATILSFAQTRTYETNVWVETIAGSDFYGYLDGQGVQTMLNGPNGITVDSKGNVLFMDSRNFRLRKVSTDGVVSTIAGSGHPGSDNGVGTNADLGSHAYWTTLAVDKIDNVYYGDGCTIRRISPQAVVTTFAGLVNCSGVENGFRTSAGFSSIEGITIDSQGSIFVAEKTSQRIRKIDTDGIVTTLAGSGNAGYHDGVGIFTSFLNPYGIVVDSVGNVFVGDEGNFVIRKITPERVVSTFAGTARTGGYREGIGTNAILGNLQSLAIDKLGNIYIAESYAVLKLSPEGRLTTLAGSSETGFADGVGKDARFKGASALALDRDGNIYVADRENNRIRKISYSPVPSTGFSIQSYAGLSITGTIGRSFRVEFANSLSESSQWFTAANILLNSSPFLWIDTDSVNHRKRFYRAVLLP